MGPVTLGVLGERLSRMESMLSEIKTDVKTVHDQALDRRVTTLESNLRWVVRAVAGAFVTIGVGAVTAILRSVN